MRRLSLETQDDEKMLLDVLNDFFEEREDGFYHKRISSEIGKYQSNAEKNRENGKKGGRPSKNKTKNNPLGSDLVSSGLPVESELKPNQKPITNNQEPSINNSSSNENDFSVIDSIQDWQQPMISEINAMIMMGSPPMPAITQDQYEYHVSRFKNYYAEKEIESANHSNQPKQSSADIYAAKLAEQRRQRDQAANTAATGCDRGYVYDMEAPL